MQNHSVLALSILATASILAETFVNGSVTATAAGNTTGVARSNAASGEYFPADVLGTAVVIAGEAIALYGRIEVGTGGKAAAADAGTVVAIALQAAAADGDRIEVLLIPN